MKNLPNLTAIRFFLATLVVVYHIPPMYTNLGLPKYDGLAIFRKGLDSVYMFFSLSGFLIIKLLFIEKETTNTIKLKDFFLRRVLRIFPLYYLILIFGFLYYHTILPIMGHTYKINYDLSTAILLAATFFPNILKALDPGGILQILWSIGIEEQFYLIIAPLILILPLKRVALFLSLFTIIYFGFYFSDYFSGFHKYQMYFYYFSFSGLCGIFSVKQNFIDTISKIKYPIFALFILYFTTSFFVDSFSEMTYHLFSMILFGLTICALVSKPIAFLENERMIYLGKISYGIYMFHVIVIQIVTFAFMKISLKIQLSEIVLVFIINFLVILLTILISHLSYQYYEAYFLNLKHNFRVKKSISNE